MGTSALTWCMWCFCIPPLEFLVVGVGLRRDFSAALVLYKLLVYFGHLGQAAEPSIKIKQTPVQSHGPLVSDSSSADS